MALILSRGPSNKAIEGEGMNLIQEEGGGGERNCACVDYKLYIKTRYNLLPQQQLNNIHFLYVF